MKRSLAAALVLLLLTGCSQPLPDPFPELHRTEDTAEAAPASETEQPSADTPAVIPPIQAETQAPLERLERYARTLSDLRDSSLLPNGTELETVGNIEENRFAVFDVDGDGADELILEITQADVNDCFTAVYDVDAAGDLRREVRYATAMRFFTDGIAVAEYRDAAETEQDFVPYAVAAYDPEGDVYTEIAYVSAIDREVLAAADLLDEYPEDADTSGTGRVYCIRSDNPVDITEYEAWYRSWHDGIEEQAVPYRALTADAIAALTAAPEAADETT